MNDRIETLAKAAGYDSITKDYMKALGFNLETFAELIIQECADICINENVSNLDLKVMRESGKFTVQDLATKSCGENLAKRIKERFGL